MKLSNNDQKWIIWLLAVPVGYWLVNKFTAAAKPAVTPNSTPVDISYL